MIKMRSDTPELHRFQVELFSRIGRPLGRERKEFLREDMVIRNYVFMIYGFFERVYFLYRRKWIDEEIWTQWAAFLKIMTKHPAFKEVHRSSSELWDEPFVDYVERPFAQEHL